MFMLQCRYNDGTVARGRGGNGSEAFIASSNVQFMVCLLNSYAGAFGCDLGSIMSDGCLSGTVYRLVYVVRSFSAFGMCVVIS